MTVDQDSVRAAEVQQCSSSVAELCLRSAAATSPDNEVATSTRRTIVHNDAHSLGRKASDLTHELSHAVLLHDPTPALDDRGCRLWNQSVEDEAQWLAGAMLLTEDAALYIVRKGISVTAAAQHFEISEQMVTCRLDVTGARTRVARARPFRIVR